MRALIIADMVGALGIWRKKQLQENSPAWRAARRELTSDVNAALEGFRRLGYREIIVKEVFASGTNLLPHLIIPNVRYEWGIRTRPVPFLGNVLWSNCSVLLGMHARAGRQEGFFPHTFSNFVHELRIHGRPMGETQLLAAALGEMGISVNLVTGDRATLEDAKADMPWISTVEIPKDREASLGLKDGGAIFLKKRNEIRSQVEKACVHTKTFPRFVVKAPVDFELEFKTADQATLHNSWGLRQQGACVRWTTPEFTSGFRMLFDLLFVPRPLSGLAPLIYQIKSGAGRLRHLW